MRNDLLEIRGAGYRSVDSASNSAGSPDQAAVIWDADGRVVAAWPVRRERAGQYEIDVQHFASGFNVGSAIDLRRPGTPLSADTFFSTTVSEFAERTRILALDGERLALSDEHLVEWLINAERDIVLGTDSHPLFETSLEETACTIRRLPNGLVAMTEVPRSHVTAARERIRSLISGRASADPEVCVETPLRAVARYFLTALPEGEALLHSGREAEVTAFLLVCREGFSYGMWSPNTGLFSEYSFIAPNEMVQARPGETAAAESGSEDAYVRHAFDELKLQFSDDRLEHLALSGYGQIVWAAEDGLAGTVGPIAAEYASSLGVECFQLPAPVNEAAAGGLLLGSFGFGAAYPAGAEILPRVDLARDLLVLADSEESQRQQSDAALVMRRRNRAIMTMLAPPIAVAACIAAIICGLLLSQFMNTVRETRADARTQELKPALDRRNSYEANLRWYQEFISQVSRLRRQQPVGIGMMYQLNPNYPFNIDPAFYISDMKLMPTGAMEMKGYALNKDAIATFLKSLEFAGGTGSGSRLFGNLAYEVQEGAPQAAAAPGQALPAMSGSVLAAAGPRPGIIAWSLKGNYLPMAEFQPPAPAPAPGAPVTAAPVPKPAS